MSSKKKIKSRQLIPLAAAVISLAGVSVANAETSPFQSQTLHQGYQVADKGTAGTCGGKMKEGKCGSKMKQDADDTQKEGEKEKNKEGKGTTGKCATAKCANRSQ